jgi:ATP-dependent DNA ligase
MAKHKENPIPPMEARSVDEIPVGPEWQYEPKWDGFRCIAVRDGDSVELQSKSGKPLTRYFPEVVTLLLALKAKRFTLDGELVVPVNKALSFDDLLQRIHPAASRIKKLAAEHPATFIVFDLLQTERGASLLDVPLAERRPKLEQFAKRFFARHKQMRLSPATTVLKTAKQWFKKVGGNLDGIIAKRLDMTYQSGNRDGMVKIKLLRTADCVVGGFRYAEGKPVVGSLLLGLYNDAGELDHVGFTSSFKQSELAALTKKLKPLRAPPGFSGKAPGGPSRWSTKRSTEWEPLKTKLVVEVQYDHFTGGRFRHGTTLLRWRPDKAPRQCTLEQVKRGSDSALKLTKDF